MSIHVLKFVQQSILFTMMIILSLIWTKISVNCLSTNMDTHAFINAYEIAPLKTVIEAYLLIKWL